MSRHCKNNFMLKFREKVAEILTVEINLTSDAATRH